MVQLFVLRVAVAFWRQSLSMSRKLRGRTWTALAITHAAIAVFSFSAYYAESVPESAIPPVYFVHLMPTPRASAVVETVSGPRNANTGPSIISIEWVDGAAMRSYGSTHGISLTSSIIETGFGLGHVAVVEGPFDRWLPRLPQSNRITIQASGPAVPSLLTPAQQIVAILVGIVTAFLAILNTLMAWQICRRSKAQEILLQLQIAKLQREMAELTARDEQARMEASRSSLVTLS